MSKASMILPAAKGVENIMEKCLRTIWNDDEFVFWGAKVHIRKQIGNAVPPLLAEAIANRIAEYFGLKKE